MKHPLLIRRHIIESEYLLANALQYQNYQFLYLYEGYIFTCISELLT